MFISKYMVITKIVIKAFQRYLEICLINAPAQNWSGPHFVNNILEEDANVALGLISKVFLITNNIHFASQNIVLF